QQTNSSPNQVQAGPIQRKPGPISSTPQPNHAPLRSVGPLRAHAGSGPTDLSGMRQTLSGRSNVPVGGGMPHPQPPPPGGTPYAPPGGSGNAVHPDRYGRERAQFDWDRAGNKGGPDSSGRDGILAAILLMIGLLGGGLLVTPPGASGPDDDRGGGDPDD